MPFDSAGIFTRLRSWASDATAGIKIRSDYHDANDDDIAAGLSLVITKDGRTQPTANLPMNGKRLMALGEPSNPDDAATKNYVDTIKTFATGMTVTGANYPNGFFVLSASTGITGISWANADMAWVGKVAEAAKWSQRLAVNNKADASGTDIVTIDDAGVINITNSITNNLSFDGTDWRTIAAGIGTTLILKNGVFTLQSNDTATTDPFGKATLSDFFTVDQNGITVNASGNDNASPHANLRLRKKKGGTNAQSIIWGMADDQARWHMTLGDSVAETGGAAGFGGGNFALAAYNNSGTGGKTMMYIDRATNMASFYGDISLTGGNVRSTQGLILSSAGGNAIYMFPNGYNNSFGQCLAHPNGSFYIYNGHLFVNAAEDHTGGAYLGLGQAGRNGTNGGYTGIWHNWYYTGGLTYVLVNNTNTGAIQMVCDYRTKRNEKALPSTWEQVKKLRPITYQYRGVPDLIEGDKDDDEIRWGFVAHELQATLAKSAATFEKDAPNAIQAPNLMAIVAALTKALQEAQARIEALEARQA